MNPGQELEIKSSAVTLSDMELFVFPELIYSLVLANIISPRIWRWREDDWFQNLEKMKPSRRVNRLKQYIMDHYSFNLDLDTWGLTTREKEMARFRDFISEDTLRQSNALFGYQGDRYYFDIDIRAHFGLDKYQGNVIPYWKTETVEAMDAFRFKPNYGTGAGECVSLATLYAAALFVVARIPLSDIYLMATPLHSQNFIDLDEGILTNNRRLLTRNMWFNGTALSAQARRALENERITIVAHESGHIHTVYPDATISPNAYEHFSRRLSRYLKTRLDQKILGNFLRHHRDLQRCFQLKFTIFGEEHYIALERLYAYEHGSPYRLTDNTRDRLLAGVDREEFQSSPFPHRIVLNDLEAFVRENHLEVSREEDLEVLREHFSSICLDTEKLLHALRRFCFVSPRLPAAAAKRFAPRAEPLGIDPEMSREEIIARLEDLSPRSAPARLVFYASRALDRVEAEPFLLAAVQRNPVSRKALADRREEEIFGLLESLPGDSIYDGPARLAQPDEVWNFGRGDGLEKAILLAGILRERLPDEEITIEIRPGLVLLRTARREYRFSTNKTKLAGRTWTIPR